MPENHIGVTNCCSPWGVAESNKEFEAPDKEEVGDPNSQMKDAGCSVKEKLKCVWPMNERMSNIMPPSLSLPRHKICRPDKGKVEIPPWCHCILHYQIDVLHTINV